MPKPIITRAAEGVAWKHPQRSWSYDEILELFPDGDDSLVNPLVRRCQQYEAEIQRLKEALEKIVSRDRGVTGTRVIARAALDFKEENV